MQRSLQLRGTPQQPPRGQAARRSMAAAPPPAAAAAGSSAGDGSSASDERVLQRVQQQFAQRAGRYETDTSWHGPLAQKLLSLCALAPGQALLDLAAGTGLVAVPAAAAVGSAGRVVAVDVCQEMLDVAADKAAAAGLGPPQLQLLCGDMEALDAVLPPALAGTFDAATCSAAAPFLRRPAAAVAAWRRWLRPGGRLALNAFVPPAIEEYGLFCDMARSAGADERDPSAALGSPERVADALRDGGFSSVQVEPELRSRWLPAASPADHAERMWQLALHMNPFRSPAELEAALGGPDALAALRTKFDAAVGAALARGDRFDATQGRVLSRCTVLHVLATA